MISKDFLCRVKENLDGEAKGPFCIDLVINNSCNLSCFYCSGSAKRDYRAHLTREVLVKILESARKLSVQEISITSLIGEPTIFNDIEFLMEEIKKRHLIGSLLSNGAVFDLRFAEFIQKIKWDVLILSLDSFNPGIQYKLRPHVNKNNYLEKIIDFLEYTAKNNPLLDLNLNMVVTNLNYNDIENYFKRAESLGVKNITLLKLTKMNDNYERLTLSDSQLKDFKCVLKNIKTAIHFNQLEWLEKINNHNSEGDPGTSETTRKRCYFHLYKILVNCDGQILKCNGESQRTRFSVYAEDLCDIYYRLMDTYKDLRVNPPCWDICCSPIKALNQEIDHCLESSKN